VCGNCSSSAVFNFCNNQPQQIVNLQQCNPIFQPCPSGPFIYFTNPTGFMVNGSFTLVSTSTHCVMNVNYTVGGVLLTVVIQPGRSETIFFQDLNTITIECLMGAIAEANCTGNLLLDLHYCVRC
jgi:hypothetical protein